MHQFPCSFFSFGLKFHVEFIFSYKNIQNPCTKALQCVTQWSNDLAGTTFKVPGSELNHLLPGTTVSAQNFTFSVHVDIWW